MAREEAIMVQGRVMADTHMARTADTTLLPTDLLHGPAIHLIIHLKIELGKVPHKVPSLDQDTAISHVQEVVAMANRALFIHESRRQNSYQMWLSDVSE